MSEADIEAEIAYWTKWFGYYVRNHNRCAEGVSPKQEDHHRERAAHAASILMALKGMLPCKKLNDAREAFGRIAALNDLEDAPHDAIEAYARNALYECELIAREALEKTS